MQKQSMINSFRNAYNGVLHTLLTERNMKIHFFAACCVIAAAVILKISPLEWIAVIIALTLVIASELINTAVEAAVDLCTQEYHPLAKVAKDAAAGAVLVCALCSVCIGIIVFFPYIFELLY